MGLYDGWEWLYDGLSSEYDRTIAPYKTPVSVKVNEKPLAIKCCLGQEQHPHQFPLFLTTTFLFCRNIVQHFSIGKFIIPKNKLFLARTTLVPR